MKLLIKNSRVIDPANNRDEILDILVEDGKIIKLAKGIDLSVHETIDASGKIAMPALVDMHVHLREPGREDKETVKSGTLAALKGGVGSLLVMPNTEPAMDSAENVRMLKELIKNSANVNVYICGAITKGRYGEELTGIAKLKNEGVVAISDDGASVDNEELLLKALLEAKEHKLPVICHCEDKKLSNRGVMNLGIISTRLGLRGISGESEYKRVERDVLLAEGIRSPIHITHVSCKESVEIIAKAKKKAIMVTCDTAPHYFSLSEEALLDYDTNMKMNPPLRTKEDVAAIRQALKDGIIDAIASDHAPHTESEKEIEFERAEFGVIGLETLLSVSITELVETGILSFSELIKKIALNPARILKINKGTLSIGADADIAIIDPDRQWMVRKEEIVSRSKNSSFLGRQLKGFVEYTIVNGICR
jgi:dihydroorotase